MRNTRWLRYGLGSFSITAAAFGAFLVACGDDDSGGGPQPDSGLPDTGNPNPDSGNPVDAGPDANKPPPNAKLQLVNAATDLGPDNPVGALRVCYALVGATETIVGLPPLPDTVTPGAPYAGVFIGTGGNVQGTGADLSAVSIIPYVMNAHALKARGVEKPAAGPGISCTDLFKADYDGGGGGALKAGVDYWKLAPIGANTLLKEKSFILVLTGCPSNSTIAPNDKCGQDFNFTGTPGNGNLKVTVHEVDRATAIAADKIGTQFIHASAAGDLLITGAGGRDFIPAYVSDPDGGGAKPVATTKVAYNTKTALVQVQGVNVATDQFTANPTVPLAAKSLAIPLPLIQRLSYGATVPQGGEYRNGAAFTFIAVGDPDPTTNPHPDGGFNTKQFHYIALPNDPQVLVYGQ